MKNTNFFKNRDALRHEYIPETLPHREEQIIYLGGITAPVLRGFRCSNVFIYGKTGTGKTAVVKNVLNRLTHKANELGASVKVCYINCRLVGTEYRILSNLCDTLNVKIPFTGLAVGEVFDRFKSGLDSNNLLLITVLDEIDTIVKMNSNFLLYKLTRINGSLKNSKISIVGISNDLHFKDFLDPRVLSTLSEEEIVFRPYNASELQDILLNRARLSLCDSVLADGAVSLCAALAAAEHGDARRALDLLRVAAELSEREGSKIISEDHVRRAEMRIEHDRTFETIKNLPPQSKLVLCSVYLLDKANIGKAITGDIYEVYREICQISGLKPLTQRRISSLINELDVIGLLTARVISLGRYGRTKKISLGTERHLIRKTLSIDDRINYLLDYIPKCLAGKSKEKN